LIVTRTSVLQLNPALLVWPSNRNLFTLGDPLNHDAAFFYLPSTAVQVLTAFATPVSIATVFATTDDNVISILQLAVDSGWLIEAITPIPKLTRFKGFALTDLPKAVSEFKIDRATQRKQTVDAKDIFELDWCFSAEEVVASFRWMLSLPFRQHDVDSQRTKQFQHWICMFTSVATQVEQTPLFARLAAIGRACFNAPDLQVTRIHAYSIGPEDVAFPHRDFIDEPGVTVLYYANPVWPYQWGSEMIYFDADGHAAAISQIRPGRVIAFRGDIEHRAGSPIPIAEARRHTLVLRLTSPTA
jgi:hypothetical protein